MTPYREHIIKYDDVKSNKQVYQYILVNSYECPICNVDICKEYIHFNSNWDRRGSWASCHPLRRFLIKGKWWWKKYCPVGGVHLHIRCWVCNIPWIYQIKDLSEVKEIPYE